MKKAKRISFSIDDEIYEKLRIIQTIDIHDTSNHVIFSKIINDVLRKSLE